MRISDWSSDVCSSDLETRAGAERQRDHDALAHAAGELVRVLVEAPLGGRDADLLQQLEGAPARRLRAEPAVGEDGLGELPPDGVERVQRRQRVLEHHADLAAADARSEEHTSELQSRKRRPY